jgi:hypothetical protein
MITSEHLDRGEEVIRTVFRLGMDNEHAHNLITNRVRARQPDFENWLMGVMGQTSRAMGACQDQGQRDATLMTALRHVAAVTAVATRLSRGEDPTQG